MQLDERVKTRRYKGFVAKGARRTFFTKNFSPEAVLAHWVTAHA